MKKIISLFQRNYDGDKLVRNEVVPGADWVLAGEGAATRKWDGTCCAVINGLFYKRLEWDLRKGPATAAWLHWDFDPAQRSGHGWFPVGEGPEDWMHREAWKLGTDDATNPLFDGTYELCGPRLRKNVEGLAGYVLVPHGRDVLHDVPRDFDGLREWLRGKDIEGLVFYHPDGRLVKVKLRDFGLHRPQRQKQAV